MPEGVKVNDEVFGRNTADVHYWQSNVKGRHNWVGQTERQTRFDYVQRVLRATGQRSEPDDVKDALYKVWEWLQDQGVFIGNSQTGFQSTWHGLFSRQMTNGIAAQAVFV